MKLVSDRTCCSHPVTSDYLSVKMILSAKINTEVLELFRLFQNEEFRDSCRSYGIRTVKSERL
jgi:hypothetical protein